MVTEICASSSVSCSCLSREITYAKATFFMIILLLGFSELSASSCLWQLQHALVTCLFQVMSWYHRITFGWSFAHCLCLCHSTETNMRLSYHPQQASDPLLSFSFPSCGTYHRVLGISGQPGRFVVSFLIYLSLRLLNWFRCLNLLPLRLEVLQRFLTIVLIFHMFYQAFRVCFRVLYAMSWASFYI